MKLEYIITLANTNSRLRFLGMERSLRAVGCNLPLKVIPYDDRKFSLPSNASWWEMPGLISWMTLWRAHPTMRKYQCLTIGNYQFVDSDVCWLRNPEVCLLPYEGFVTSCGHWNNPKETVTRESEQYLRKSTTVWQHRVFNTGQFACDRPLYTEAELKKKAEESEFKWTCLQLPHHEQPGLNLLVSASGIPITNLTLPPAAMESTWAGDYWENYRAYWADESRMPYLIHWAGVQREGPRPIDEIFLSYLTQEERREWNEQEQQLNRLQDRRRKSLRGRLGRLRWALLNSLQTR